MPISGGSQTVTDGVQVSVTPFYLPEESRPDHGRYLFAYRVRIRNEGEQTVQLMKRHWIIIDADGHREDVRGSGVVGQTPHLEPGRGFMYTSYCPLSTTWGTMEGAFEMQREDGERFEARVGRFLLTMESRELEGSKAVSG